jgi:hypothetical protein
MVNITIKLIVKIYLIFISVKFYEMANLKDKSDYYCNKYDINSIPKIDNSYAILK